MNAVDLKFYSHTDADAVFIELASAALYGQKKFKTQYVRPLVRAVRLSGVTTDMYCPECGRETTFKAVTHKTTLDLQAKQNAADNRYAGNNFPGPPMDWTSEFTLVMSCARQNHLARFYFVSRIESITSIDEERFYDYEWIVTKVGQIPSVVDFHRSDFRRFESILNRSQIGDMRRAISTAAHGFNVAACVYYRRVFEGLIDNAKIEHMHKRSLVEWREFDIAKTDDRIKMLKDELPEFMTAHPKLYSILSKAVHDLTEEECEAEMPLLHDAIELILNEQLLAKERLKSSARVATLLKHRIDKDNLKLAS